MRDCNENLIIAPNGLLGDRLPGRIGVWGPGNMLYDIAAEHSKLIDGAIIEALMEIEGRRPNHFELEQGLGKLLHDPTNSILMTILWKGEPILEVHAPEMRLAGGRTIIHRKIKQVWKQRFNVMRVVKR